MTSLDTFLGPISGDFSRPNRHSLSAGRAAISHIYEIIVPFGTNPWVYTTDNEDLFNDYKAHGFCGMDAEFRNRFVHSCPVDTESEGSSWFVELLTLVGYILLALIIVSAVLIITAHLIEACFPKKKEEAQDQAERGEYNGVEPVEIGDNESIPETKSQESASHENEEGVVQITAADMPIELQQIYSQREKTCGKHSAPRSSSSYDCLTPSTGELVNPSVDGEEEGPISMRDLEAEREEYDPDDGINGREDYEIIQARQRGWWRQ